MLLVLLASSAFGKDAGRDPAWVRGLEAANPFVSTAVDTLGAATDAISKTKDLKASQIAISEGNRAARKVLAAEHNALRQSGLTVAKAADKVNLGTATMVADVGGTLAGHLVEGDLRAVPGVVGAAAGAVGTGWGYDAANEALAKRGHHSVQSYVDSLAAEAPVDYVEKARAARREHLRAQQEMQRRAEIRRSEQLPGEIEKAREARRDHLEQEQRKDDAEKWRERQERRTGTGAPDAPPRTDIPVIPVDCTIDVVFWHEQSPSDKFQLAFRVNGEEASVHSEASLPGRTGENYRASATPIVFDISGIRKDNVISGTGRTRTGPSRQVTWWTSSEGGRSTRHECTTEWSSDGTSKDEWIFLLGGKGRFRTSGHGTTTHHFSAGCDHKPGENQTSTYSYTDEGKLHFTWRIR